MKNKEKYDLRELTIMKIRDFRNNTGIFKIFYYGLIHEIILPLDETQYFMKEYNDWLEAEVQEDDC